MGESYITVTSFSALLFITSSVFNPVEVVNFNTNNLVSNKILPAHQPYVAL